MGIERLQQLDEGANSTIDRSVQKNGNVAEQSTACLRSEKAETVIEENGSPNQWVVVGNSFELFSHIDEIEKKIKEGTLVREINPHIAQEIFRRTIPGPELNGYEPLFHSHIALIHTENPDGTIEDIQCETYYDPATDTEFDFMPDIVFLPSARPEDAPDQTGEQKNRMIEGTVMHRYLALIALHRLRELHMLSPESRRELYLGNPYYDQLKDLSVIQAEKPSRGNSDEEFLKHIKKKRKKTYGHTMAAEKNDFVQKMLGHTNSDEYNFVRDILVGYRLTEIADVLEKQKQVDGHIVKIAVRLGELTDSEVTLFESTFGKELWNTSEYLAEQSGEMLGRLQSLGLADSSEALPKKIQDFLEDLFLLHTAVVETELPSADLSNDIDFFPVTTGSKKEKVDKKKKREEKDKKVNNPVELRSELVPKIKRNLTGVKDRTIARDDLEREIEDIHSLLLQDPRALIDKLYRLQHIVDSMIGDGRTMVWRDYDIEQSGQHDIERKRIQLRSPLASVEKVIKIEIPFSNTRGFHSEVLDELCTINEHDVSGIFSLVPDFVLRQKINGNEETMIYDYKPKVGTREQNLLTFLYRMGVAIDQYIFEGMEPVENRRREKKPKDVYKPLRVRIFGSEDQEHWGTKWDKWRDKYLKSRPENKRDCHPVPIFRLRELLRQTHFAFVDRTNGEIAHVPDNEETDMMYLRYLPRLVAFATLHEDSFKKIKNGS